MVLVPCEKIALEEKAIASLGESGSTDDSHLWKNFSNVPAETIRNWKLLGFGDEQIAKVSLNNHTVTQQPKTFRQLH